MAGPSHGESEQTPTKGPEEEVLPLTSSGARSEHEEKAAQTDGFQEFLDKSRLLLSSGSPAPQMGKDEDFRRFLDAARAELRRKQGR